MSKGFFLVIEGPDGAGKTTQLHLLGKKLVEFGYDIVLTREPGGTAIGEQIRGVLHNISNQGMSAETEFLLFSASRAQHVADVITPAMKAGKVVISDRYWTSSIAYQSHGRKLSYATLMLITRFACKQYTKPDLVIYIDLTTEALERRLVKRQSEGGAYNRLDQLKYDFRERVRRGYLNMIEKNPWMWHYVNGDQSIDKVHNEIIECVLPRIRKRFGER